MYNASQLFRLLDKQSRFVGQLEAYIFKKAEVLSLKAYQTFDKLDSPPAESLYHEVKTGDEWGAEKAYCWFKAEFFVPKKLDGKQLYLRPEFGGYEALLFVNGVPHTNYANKRLVGSHGNHYCKSFALSAKQGETYALDLEAYAGHNFEGNHPFAEPATRNYHLTVGEFAVCIKDELFYEFYYDYKTLQDLYDVLDENSFKKAELERAFVKLHEVLYYDIENCEPQVLREAVAKADALLKPILQKHNSESAPKAGLLGHSHMDTAWTWEIDETIKKCARTYANQLNLMDQFPEYRFLQSSALHLKFMEDHYPALFEKMKARILEGRYEPNGGVWVECDCNITGGEFLIRQFLWGQNYTRKHFGFTSNSFYLPDTFGYSAALPQIMKGCHVQYFLTTKLSWNESNRFPYETYYWQGIDGTKVLTHHNVTHCAPSPKTLTNVLNKLQQKAVSDTRLVTFGHGDGGGGPEDAMLETAARIHDLEGCPKAYYTSLTDFMVQLEKSLYKPATYRGELYLELHRGTLTNQHTIKRNNRKAEIAIRNAELLTVMEAVQKGEAASSEKIAPLVGTLLMNQFHDILPGTCIPEAHDRSIRETTQILKDAGQICSDIMCSDAENAMTLFNTLSFARSDVIELPVTACADLPRGAVHQQIIEKQDGESVLHLSGLKLGAFECKTISFTKENREGNSPFHYADSVLETPFASVIFDQKGYISSFIDKRNGRELRGNGHSLNTFLFGEEVSAAWDCWDINADVDVKLTDCAELLSFEVVADGAVEFRIRTSYRISPKTTLWQDMVFYADDPRVDFETTVDWNDKHRLLKVEFDTSVLAEYSVHEIQYGNIKRPVNRNTAIEQAKFEVSNHKYTDLSEPGYGVAVLNDCKYGVSVLDSCIALTLHKGGCKPDPRGDRGVHHFTYSFYPHPGALSGENTIRAAYELNHPILHFAGDKQLEKLFTVEKPNILAEAIKPCEEGGKAYIVRLYEAEGSYTATKLEFVKNVSVYEVDMLETNARLIDDFCPGTSGGKALEIKFRPFEIKTFKVCY